MYVKKRIQVSKPLSTDKMDEHRNHFRTTFEPIYIRNESQQMGWNTLKKIIKWYPNGKTSGEDQIYVEMLKLGENVCKPMLAIMRMHV